MKYCQKCGKQLNDDAMFCDKCGTNQNAVVSKVEDNPVITAVGTEQKDFAIKLKRVATALIQYSNLEKEISEYRKFLVDYNAGKTRMIFAYYLPFFIPGLILTIMGFSTLVYSLPTFALFRMAGDKSEAMMYLVTTIIFFIFGIAGVCLLIVGKPVAHKKTVESRVPFLKRIVKEVEEKESKLFTTEFFDTINMIPKDYQYEFAIRKLSEYFENGRAETLKEAINLFEIEKHQWRLENFQAQQMKQLNSIRRFTKVNAAANIATAVYHYGL